MSDKNIELDYTPDLNRKIINKIGVPGDNLPENLMQYMCKHYENDMIIIGKRILVIRMLDLAKQYAVKNSVTYITDNKEKYNEFLKAINNKENYGEDDSVELIEDWNSIGEIVKNMPTFDFIIGNPPYEGKYTPLYLQILEVCQKVANKVVWLCPAQWVKSYHYTNGCEKIRKVVGKTLCSYEHISSPFENAYLANEVGIYVFDKSKYNINYNEIFWEKFTKKDLAKSIVNKFKSYKDNVNNHSDRTNISILPGNWCNICRIRGNVRESQPLWDWTTLFGKESKNNFKYKVGTHMNHIKFDTVDECKNFIAYTETDIICFAIYVSKDNNNQTPSMLNIIPWLGDYTHEWTEEAIAKELNLTQEEVDYIHEEMKNFGWKAAPKKKSK